MDLLTTAPLQFASLSSWDGTVAELLDELFDPTMTLADPPAGFPERQVQDVRPDLTSVETVRRSSRVH